MPRPRTAIPKVAPLPQRQVPRPGHKGTRPGTGGDPAPAPKALRMHLPQSSSNRTVNPNSRVLQGSSTEGDPDRGHAFGDPNGVHGGTGTGGNGPGGTGGEGGGDGDGGFQITAATTPEDILRAGVIQCNGCHAQGNLGPAATRPINVETMSDSTGWNIGQAPKGRYAIPVEFEYQLDADGKVLNIRILKTAQNPVLQEALKYFAEIHQWTPPNPRAPCYAVAIYNFYPPDGLR